MQCPKCRHTNPVEAKFCMECGAKLELACSKCGATLPAEAKFCMACGTSVGQTAQPVAETAAVPKLEDLHAQLQSLIPDALAQKYLTAEQTALGENRLITALFADISGFTPLSATQSSETIFQLVGDCFKQLVNIVANYEGSISGFRGDGLLALFGAPILHENDAERAVLAAIDMVRVMGERELAVSIGINTALMTVGEVQTELHKEYTAYGIDINLAARFQQAAKPGQILVGSATHRYLVRAFDFRPTPPLTLKGIDESVVAYEVLNPKVHPEKVRGIEGLRAKMIGREREFANLKEDIDAWWDGRGQVVCVIGEAGIGKSRLVSELKTYLASHVRSHDADREASTTHPLILEGRCISIGQTISYWPFIDILRTYFDLREEDDEPAIARKVVDGIEALFDQQAMDVLPLIGNLLSMDLGDEVSGRLTFATPEQIRHQTLMRLRDVFETLARKTPLLLILEDLHWADELSLELISLLMDSLATMPLMLLCVYRPEREHRVSKLSQLAQRKCLDRFTELTLKPLTDYQSRRLVEALLSIDNLPDRFKETILRKSEGNPFFIEEVIRSLIDQDIIYHENERWKACDEIADIDVPDTIQSVVLARVDRLNAEAKHVLQCAAVIGRLFKHRLLAYLAQQEQRLEHHLSEFEQRDLIYEERMIPELEYAFKHAFTQEATYQGILECRRYEFHLQVARGIEQLYQERVEEYYEELAYHYARSDDTEKAVDYLLKAGERAQSLYANDEALAYFNQAFDRVPENDFAKHYAILSNREQVYDIQGNREAQRNDLQTLKQLAETLDDDLKRSEVALREANCAEATGDYPVCITAAQQAIGWAQAVGDIKCEATSRLAWGQGLLRQGNNESARSQFEHALTQAQGAHLSQVEADSLRNLGNAVPDSYAQAKQYYEQSRQICRGIGDRQSEAKAIHGLGFVAWGEGDYAGAKECYERALQIYREIGDRRFESQTLSSAGFILTEEGDYVGAKAYYEQARHICREIGDRAGEARAFLSLGITVERQGNHTQASTYQEQSLRIHREIGNRQGQFTPLFHLGVAAIARCDYEPARAYSEESLQICRELGHKDMEGWCLINLGTIDRCEGNYAGAKTHYGQALRLFQETGNRVFEGRIINSLGYTCKVQGDSTGARTYYEQSLHLFREVGNRAGESGLLSSLGELAVSEGDYPRAQAYSEHALQICREISNRAGEGYRLNQLGHICLAQGDYAGARTYYEQALEIFDEDGNRGGKTWSLLAMGLVSHHLGADEVAQQYCREALHLTQELGDLSSQGNLLNCLGRALVGLGQMTEAISVYQQAVTRCRETGQQHHAMESLAGLADIAHTAGDLNQAQVYVEEILTHIDKGPLDLLEPLRVYLICYRVLEATQDPRAKNLLSTAHRLLQERAAKIKDDNLQHSFWENVAAHREIRREYEKTE